MRNKLKMGISMALSLAMVVAFSSFAYAGEETVSTSKDNITVTKTAEWTQVNGKSVDEKGNPYAKISFKVDASKASTTITNTVSKGGSTDIMLVVDNSVSMQGSKMILAKQAASEFTQELMKVKNQTVRIGLVTFNTEGYIDLDLNSDVKHVVDKINLVKAGGGTNIQKGVYCAQTILKGSQAKNKMMIVLSDGYPNGKMKSNETGPEVATGNTDAERATNQAAIAAKVIPGLKIVTIGYDTNTKTEAILTSMATAGANNKKLFYKADVKASSVVQDLAGVFEEITETVTSYVIGNSLVDTIPAEFNIVDGTVTCNDTKLKATLSADKKTLTWTWGENKLENKVYEMSVITTFDKSKVTEADFTSGKKVYTNGTTIDVTKDSTGSAIFGYGKEGSIKLTSPKLALSSNLLVKDETTKKDETVKEDENKNTTVNPSIENVKGDDKVSATQNPENLNNSANADLDKSPKTGDTSNMTMYLLLAAGGVVVMIGTAVAMKKRRQNR